MDVYEEEMAERGGVTMKQAPPPIRDIVFFLLLFLGKNTQTLLLSLVDFMNRARAIKFMTQTRSPLLLP